MEKKAPRPIDAHKLVRDLLGIRDMLVAAGDPFLASVINRAIQCVENQPTMETQPTVEKVHPELQKVAKQLCAEYEKAKNNPIVYNPIGYALYHVWQKYE